MKTDNQFGAVWFKDKADFAHDTTFNFLIYMGDRDGNGADGIAFVMHQDPRDTIVDDAQFVSIGDRTWNLAGATGDDGGGLGFAMHESRVSPNTIPGPHGPGDDPENHKIQPSVAIEFDTWNNVDISDGKSGTDANGIPQPTSLYLGWDHTAVIYNGDLYRGQQIIEDANGNADRILPLKPAYAFGTANNPDGTPYHNIEDDRCYLFQIRWITNPDGTQTLQLWTDRYNGTTNLDGLQMVMTHTDDMIANVFSGNTLMRMGFTGSTGGSINEQTVCLLGENLKPVAQDDYAKVARNGTVVIDVSKNDNDPDGDRLNVPVIIDVPDNGIALIFDSLDSDYIRYTPDYNYAGTEIISYITCDMNTTKPYAKCDTAEVVLEVGCQTKLKGGFVDELSPYTNCQLPPDGILRAGVVVGNDTLTNEYNFEWFYQEDPKVPAFIQRTGSVANNLEAREYAVVITDIINGCDTTISAEVPNEAIIPIVTASVTDHITSCSDPNTGAGEASVGGNTTDYDFEWYAGPTIGGGAPVFTTASIKSLAAGNYTVQATDKATGCASNPRTITINDLSFSPDIVVTVNSQQTSCDLLNPNGSLSGAVNESESPTTTGYTFHWYKGPNDVIPAKDGYTSGPNVDGLEAGAYRLVVVADGTGCSAYSDIEVISDRYDIAIIASATDQTICKPNGTVQIDAISEDGVNIALNPNEWTVFLFDETQAYITPIGSTGLPGDPFISIAAGDYFLKVQNNLTLCYSDPIALTINDLSAFPTATFEIIDHSYCDPSYPTGQIAATMEQEAPSDYTFEWTDATGKVLTPTGSGDILTNLEAGNYQVTIIDKETSCSSTYWNTVDIVQCPVIPSDITFDIAEVTAIPGREVIVPVIVSAFEDVLSVQHSIGWDSNVLEFKRVESFGLQDLDAGSFNHSEIGKLTFSWMPKDNISKSLSDGSEIFHLVFDVVGNAGSASAISFTDSPTQQEVSIGTKEVVLANYLDGSVSVLEEVILGGYIKTQKKEPVVGIEVELLGGMELKTTTDETGWYEFSVIPNQEYHIAPLFDADDDDGVTTLDIIIMHWHILGKKYMMSNLDLIAADVNGSGSLTALDLVETRSVVLHNDGDKFRGKNSVEFINSEYTGEGDVFEYKNYLDIIPTVSHLELNFTAVKRGDASRSWNPNKNTGGRETTFEELNIVLDEKMISDNRINLALKALDFENIVGLQFTLEWNPAKAKFERLIDGEVHFEANSTLANEGKLMVTWNTEVLEGLSFKEGDILSGVEFSSLQSVIPEISITSGVTPALAFNADLQPYQILDIKAGGLLSGLDLKIFPNPAMDILHVGSYVGNMPEFAIATATGSIVKTGVLDNSNQIDIQELCKGIYVLQLMDGQLGRINRKFIKQ